MKFVRLCDLVSSVVFIVRTRIYRVSHETCSSKTNWKSSLNIDFQNVVWLFCVVTITGDIGNFVPILILLNKTKIFEIWTISSVKLNAQKRQPHLGNAKTRDILLLLTLEFYFKISFTHKCHRFFLSWKTTFNSSCYCYVSWDSLYIKVNLKVSSAM